MQLVKKPRIVSRLFARLKLLAIGKQLRAGNSALCLALPAKRVKLTRAEYVPMRNWWVPSCSARAFQSEGLPRGHRSRGNTHQTPALRAAPTTASQSFAAKGDEIESNPFFPAACTSEKTLCAERASKTAKPSRRVAERLPSVGLCPIRRLRGETRRADFVCPPRFSALSLPSRPRHRMSPEGTLE